MSMKTRLMIWVIALGFIDAVVPLFPILAFVLIYVLLERPGWFIDAVKEVYRTG